MSKLTNDQRRQLLVDYASGMKNKDISAKYGVAVAYGSHVAANHGIRRGDVEKAATVQFATELPPTAKPYIKKPAVKVKPEPAPIVVDTAEIRRLAAKGIGSMRIAALLRCPYREVQEALA